MPSSSVHIKGFTLIELLVVISIIAIIAAILFPVFAQVREKARQTTCTSNLRQLGLAFEQYGDDYDQRLPEGLEYGAGWAGTLYPYVHSPGVFKCPDDETSSKMNTVGSTAYVLWPVSYAYNLDVAIDPTITQGIGGVESSLVSPSKTVLLYEVTASLDPGSALNNYNVADLSTVNEKGGYQADINTTIYSPAGEGVAPYNGPGTLQQATGYSGGPLRTLYFNASVFTGPYGRHSSGANYLACDGHVKWLMGSSVSTGFYYTGMPSTINEGSMPSTNAAGTESTEGWALTFSPV
jgi:prepilin-type N-terminal cleavage/methylation domain-containing protein/prepilin-type processing-associated H-X9-DG protein